MVSEWKTCVTYYPRTTVLILVLVGYGLWVNELRVISNRKEECLNPCFGGIWSLRLSTKMVNKIKDICRLNPCFGGIWSLSSCIFKQKPIKRRSLNPCFGGIWSLSLLISSKKMRTIKSLNPCFGGIWSLRSTEFFIRTCLYVLILVLVGYGLWGQILYHHVL